ncbi:MAG: spermine synthase, partial [uncultured bacterium]
VTKLAKEYFNLKDNPRLNIFHEDGRVFLNTNQKKYDVLFGDAFSSHYSIPHQLTTLQAVQKTYDALNDDGVVILNTISSVEGNKGQFLRAELATYKSIFPQVYIFPVTDSKDGLQVQNIILVALKSKTVPSFKSNDTEINGFLSHLWNQGVTNDKPILTDDYAPVEYYINRTE